MRAHTQTMGQRPQVGVRVNVGELDWLHRLLQWCKSFCQSARVNESVSPYSVWDAKREQYRPLKADAAVDLVAARNGISWASRIYTSSI
jgi:hypothetical protein